jgi:hypothetical protein
MATAPTDEHGRWFLDTFRRYVLDPFETAAAALDREEAELSAERDALTAFDETIAQIDPADAGRRTPLVQPRTDGGDPCEAVLATYEETFVAMDHYDDVYGEPLLESVAQEFGRDLAEALSPNTPVSFSAQVKQTLRSAVQRGVRDRTALLSCVESEQESLTERRRDMVSIVESLDSSVVPEWYRDQFQTDVTAVLSERQHTLQDRTQAFDNHDFCAYLYEETPWRYPVLASVARLVESVALDTEVPVNE